MLKPSNLKECILCQFGNIYKTSCLLHRTQIARDSDRISFKMCNSFETVKEYYLCLTTIAFRGKYIVYYLKRKELFVELSILMNLAMHLGSVGEMRMTSNGNAL